MTLVVGALNNDYALQVSDRRLTGFDGKPADDESNKLILLHGVGWRCIIGYSGFAGAGSFRTREWLTTALRDAAPPDFTIGGTFSRLTSLATKTFVENAAVRSTAPRFRRLSIMFTGYIAAQGGGDLHLWIRHKLSGLPEGRR
ncbi:MAG TPA: hypothetical protein VE996_04070 [Terriglobales bacterium]|nr:hypothetical protein [Terriglobales bacterium]